MKCAVERCRGVIKLDRSSLACWVCCSNCKRAHTYDIHGQLLLWSHDTLKLILMSCKPMISVYLAFDTVSFCQILFYKQKNVSNQMYMYTFQCHSISPLTLKATAAPRRWVTYISNLCTTCVKCSHLTLQKITCKVISTELLSRQRWMVELSREVRTWSCLTQLGTLAKMVSPARLRPPGSLSAE